MTSLFDNRMREAWELMSAAVALCGGLSLVLAPPFPCSRETAWLFAGGAFGLAFWRGIQGFSILDYHRYLRRLPHYALETARVPVSRENLLLGRGFLWDSRHSQRLSETRQPEARRWLKQSLLYRQARRLEIALEPWRIAAPLRRLLKTDRWWNPVRPLPDLGGDAALHGVGFEDEEDVWMSLRARANRMLVLGVPGVGKTRLAELFISQDIRRRDIVIVLDPKGDKDLLVRCYVESLLAGRMDQFHMIHLGFPDISERYNMVGDYVRITEVASRIAKQLPDQGNSAAFREFAWRFSNSVAQALHALGRRPDIRSIARYVSGIEPLLIEYFSMWLDREGPADWRNAVHELEANIDDKKLTLALRGRESRAVALYQYYKNNRLYDQVGDGLCGAFAYDKTYYDKLTASLLPLLEKLTTGPVGELLAPDYEDLGDRRPILDLTHLIRQGGILYVGLDAVSDQEVAEAFGNSLLADLTSKAGLIYKHGIEHGLPMKLADTPNIWLHSDEFNDTVGDEFVAMVNKARGAGIQVTAYTQTSADVEVGMGGAAKARQIMGNFGNVIMMRAGDEATAETFTSKLRTTSVYRKRPESRTTDNNNRDSIVDYVAQNLDSVSEKEPVLVTPADVMQLPVGQAFAFYDGGRLSKLRLPMLAQTGVSYDDVQDYFREQYGRRAA